jgi:hypothetical protein
MIIAVILFQCKTTIATILFSNTRTLLDNIYITKTPQELCDCFTKILQEAKEKGQILISINVGTPLFARDSDFTSWQKYGHLGAIKNINRQFLECLHDSVDCLTVKAVAISNILAWYLNVSKIPPFTIDIQPNADLPSADPQLVGLKANVRSQAVSSVTPVFSNSFGQDVFMLYPVTDEAKPYAKIVPQQQPNDHSTTRTGVINTVPIAPPISPDSQPDSETPMLQPLTLGHTLQQEPKLQNLRIFQYTHRWGVRILYDFYIQDPHNSKLYAQILAWPVYVRGVIFANALNLAGYKRKGLIIRSFLRTIIPELEWPTTIIAIETNPEMLRNIQMLCMELDAIFVGILYRPPCDTD